jgi:NAD(P)H-quinone oxidoreductase subunit K
MLFAPFGFGLQVQFHVGRSMNTGNYDQGLLYQSPSTSEIPSETFFKYRSSLSSHELVN